jgi:hypothetical protein
MAYFSSELHFFGRYKSMTFGRTPLDERSARCKVSTYTEQHSTET